MSNEATNTVFVNGEEFIITPLNATKTAFIANLFGRLLISGKLQLKQFKGLDPSDLPIAILSAVTSDMLIELAAVLINSDEEFARDNFDIVWVTDALRIQVENGGLDKVIRNFTSIVSQVA